MQAIGLVIVTVGLVVSIAGAFAIEEHGAKDALKIVLFGNGIMIFGGLFAGGMF